MKQFSMRLFMTLATMALVLSPFGYALSPEHSLATPAYAESKDDGPSDEDGNGTPDDMEGWETPYETPKELLEAFTTAENGTCWDVMNAKLNLFLDETQYWTAQAVPGSEGERFINKVLGFMLDFQVGMSNNRYDLEKRSGKTSACEGNSEMKYVQEPLEKLKMRMRRAGWLIDTGEDLELTDQIVAKRCDFANQEVKELGNKIDKLNDKLNKKAADGKFGEVSNLKELLNMATQAYGDASAGLTDSENLTDLEKKMRACSGARDNANLGLSLFKRANKFHKGKNDKSGPVEEVDAKIKMFLSVIAEKKLEALARDGDKKEEILVLLSKAEKEIVAVQIAFAKIKYEKDANNQAKEFDDELEQIKKKLKPLVDALENSDGKKLSKAARKRSAKKLVKKARKQIKTLNKQLRKKDKKADSDEEEDIVQFVDLTTTDDAANARSAAKAYRKNKQYAKAQLQALQAIHTAKSGKQMLKEVK